MAYQFAAIKPKAGEELSLVDYMDESALMVKAPLKTVNEQLRVLVSNPDLFTKDASDKCL